MTVTQHAYKAFLWRHLVAFEDTNLVGNVYFAKFISWQGRCRETFLAEHAPDMLRELHGDLRLVTLNVACEYYQELRAFDVVELEMRLAEQDGHRLGLAFDYHVIRGGAKQLVACGSQKVACMRQDRNGSLVPTAVPPALSAALTSYASKDRGVH